MQNFGEWPAPARVGFLVLIVAVAQFEITLALLMISASFMLNRPSETFENYRQRSAINLAKQFGIKTMDQRRESFRTQLKQINSDIKKLDKHYHSLAKNRLDVRRRAVPDAVPVS